jgi:hypothetical protein
MTRTVAPDTLQSNEEPHARLPAARFPKEDM